MLENSISKKLLAPFAALVILSCTNSNAISARGAVLEYEQGHVWVRVDVRCQDIDQLITNGGIVYIGVGDCSEEEAEIYSSASLDGLRLSDPSIAENLNSLPQYLTLSVVFDESELVDVSCAFVKGASMSGRGGQSGPIPISATR
jgi:hypothetical protein